VFATMLSHSVFYRFLSFFSVLLCSILLVLYVLWTIGLIQINEWMNEWIPVSNRNIRSLRKHDLFSQGPLNVVLKPPLANQSNLYCQYAFFHWRQKCDRRVDTSDAAFVMQVATLTPISVLSRFVLAKSVWWLCIARNCNKVISGWMLDVP